MLYSKKSKILIAFLTVLPFIISIIGISILISYMSDTIDNFEGEDDPFINGGFRTFFIMHMISWLISMIMLGFYIIYIVKSDRVKKDSRVIWIIVVLFGSTIGQLVFWFMHIWPDEVNYKEVALGPIFPKNSAALIGNLYCPNCNYPAKESHSYCMSCGKYLADIIRFPCEKCGKMVCGDWIVCAYCGTRL